MKCCATTPLGYAAALRVLKLGRSAFFGTAKTDLPVSQSAEVEADDLTPQFGYVGAKYMDRGILFLGINPGNGPRDARNPGDAAVMPTLYAFCANPTPANFILAQKKYEQVCSGWRLWGVECHDVLQASGLGATDIAFTNALPFRAGTTAAFSKEVAKNAARHYLSLYLLELRPKIILSLGKRAGDILALAGGPGNAEHLVWNRARAARPSVIAERESTLARLGELLRPNVS